LAQQTGVLTKYGNISGIFVDFWSVWSGLGTFCKYFLKPRVLWKFFQAHRVCNIIYNKLKGFFANFARISFFWNYFPTVKSMSRIHGAVDRQRGQEREGDEIKRCKPK
jgi:hypothetical protein